MTHVPEGWSTITPRIVAKDAAGLIEFLHRVFGATGEFRGDAPALVQIGDSKLLVSEAGERAAHAAFLYVYLEEVEAAYRRAVELGARSLEAPGPTPYGDLRCMLEDAWGNTWQIARHGC